MKSTTLQNSFITLNSCQFHNINEVIILFYSLRSSILRELNLNRRAKFALLKINCEEYYVEYCLDSENANALYFKSEIQRLF